LNKKTYNCEFSLSSETITAATSFQSLDILRCSLYSTIYFIRNFEMDYGHVPTKAKADIFPRYI